MYRLRAYRGTTDDSSRAEVTSIWTGPSTCARVVATAYKHIIGDGLFSTTTTYITVLHLVQRLTRVTGRIGRFHVRLADRDARSV